MHLNVRGDAGYGIGTMLTICEQLRVEYLFGIAANRRLQAASDNLLSQAVQLYEQTQVPLRLFQGFWYEANSWERARWVIVKAEANAQGTNRRFVVTNRPGAQVLPGAAYDDYAERGESENRNKELKCGLQIDRTSDHRFLANYFRLYLHSLAYNLMVRFRRAMALPKEPSALPEIPSQVPPEALPNPERQQHYQRQRQRDPLAQAQPCTWRNLLIKVAAEIIVSTRRIVVRLSASWPHLPYYQSVCQTLAETNPTPHSNLGTS